MDDFLKDTDIENKNKIFYMTELIQVTSLFLEFIKKQYFLLLFKNTCLKALNFKEISKSLLKYIDVLWNFINVFMVNFNFENADDELLKHISEFIDYLAENDENLLKDYPKNISKHQQMMSLIQSFDPNMITSLELQSIKNICDKPNHFKLEESPTNQSLLKTPVEENESMLNFEAGKITEINLLRGTNLKEKKKVIHCNSKNPNFEDFEQLLKQNKHVNLQDKNKSDAFMINQALTESEFLKTLSKGFEVSIKHVQSPTEFYVLLKDVNLDLFEELQMKLKSIPVNTKVMNEKKTSTDKILLHQKMDDHVLYYSICDEAWYRARVLDWCLKFDDDLVLIFIVDTGETKCISISYLKSMPPEIKDYPIFLKQCYLSGICPINNQKVSTKFIWMNNATEQMRVWIETSEKTTIKIDPHSPTMFSSSLPVTLWLFEKEKSINQMLIENGLANVFIPENCYESKQISETMDSVSGSSKMENWNPMKEDYEAYNNTIELNIMNPSTIIYGFPGNDSKRVCQHFARKGKCYKGNSCKKDHEVLNPLGFTIQKEKIFINSMLLLQKPSIDEELKIEITVISEINKFCCVLVPLAELQEETLSSLNAYLNETKNVSNMRKLIVPPSVGQIVITKSYNNDYWYRAQVLESEPENDKYTVLFVDHGNEEIVPIKRIRAIEPEYLHLPFQCVRCLIYGIEKTAKESSERGIFFLKSIIKKKDLFIKVVSVLPGTFLSLMVHLYDNKGNDIAKELVIHNFAKYREEMVFDDSADVFPG